ncbi:MAG: site-specific integrase [Burkholderiales bacterium]
MASFSRRGDQVLAQVRINRGGVVVFSESKLHPSEEVARRWAAALEQKIRLEGVAGAATSNKTLGDLLDLHLAYQRRLRPVGRSSIQNHDYMSSQLGRLRLSDLTTKHFIDFALRRRAEGVTPATILANLAIVSAAMHAALHAHGVRVDTECVDLAMRRLKDSGVVAKSRSIDRPMTIAEEAALMEEFRRGALHHQTAIDMVSVFRVAVALPRRASEFTRLRWRDIDGSKKTITIRDVKHPTRKTGNDQVVPLLGDAWKVIQAVPRVDERIFPYNTDSMCTAFERARNRIAETGMPGIKDLRFHDLRHTGITRLFEMGFSIQEVAIVSGHTNWAQLKRYTHIKPESLHTRFDELAAA